jgi:hypothetical protein
VQRERSHTVYPFDAGSHGLEVRVPLWQRMAELAQRRWLEVVGSHRGDERANEINSPCAAVTRRSRADSVMHKYDGSR